MSSKPKFEVGEVVILVSDKLPQHNGEYSVTRVFGPYEVDELGWTAPCFSYELGFEFQYMGETCCGWQEGNLKKKHLPGSLSFRDLMQTLKDPSYA